MAKQREHPYIWATWIARLLAGQNSCHWASWFKAHHQNWDRPPSDFDQADWVLNHTRLLNQQKAEWEGRGYDVHVEAQNTFRLQGQTATLAGKPDLIVVRGDHTLIIDTKAGQEQPWHNVQVMIYMYALPRALPQYRNARISGEVVYPNRIARVPRGSLHTDFIQDLTSLIRRLASDTPPAQVPSPSECRFCDISAVHCPERTDPSIEHQPATTADF